VSGLRYTIFRGVLNALYFSGAHWMLKPIVGGAGTILMLHHVRPARPDRFQPNHLLEVTPKFFERVIKRLRKSKIDLISLDEMHRRLVSGDFPRRFVCVTFDDGYRDNHEFAYPVLKKYEVPFAIYVATSFADRVGELWWLALEAVIAQNELIGIRLDGTDRWFEARSIAEKRAVYDHIYAWLRQLPTEAELRRVMRELTSRHRVDMQSFARELCMDWQELAALGRAVSEVVVFRKVRDEIRFLGQDQHVEPELVVIEFHGGLALHGFLDPFDIDRIGRGRRRR